MNRPSNPSLRGAFRLPGRAFPSLCALLLAACSTTAGPRVLEVTSRTRLQDVDIADRDYFIGDRASLITYQPQDLSINDQREEFYVRWTPRTINLVKFEYRQVARPGVVSEETYVPQGDARKLFVVGGEQFRSGGVVSAWRVSLWDGDKVVAEEKSVLW